MTSAPERPSPTTAAASPPRPPSPSTRSGYTLPLRDLDLDDAVHALDFPYSVPSAETRAAIRAALAVLDADYTVSVTR